MLIIGYFLLSLLCVSAGDIRPRTSKPVLLEYNNAGISSTHTFSFLSDSAVTSGLQLLIRFPPQYELTPCQVLFLPSLALPSRVEGLVLIVDVQSTPELVDERYAMRVHGLRTPKTPGLTGLFGIELRQGETVVDFNDCFAQVGITSAFTPMSQPQFSCLNACQTGAVSSYRLTVQLPFPISPDLLLLMRVPEGFSWQSQQSCSSPEAPLLNCSRPSFDTLRLKGWDSQHLTVTFEDVRNPLAAGDLGPFTLEVMEDGAGTLLTRSPPFHLQTFQARDIIVEQVCPSRQPSYCTLQRQHLAPASLLAFNITAHTSNPIPARGYLELRFSADFLGLEPGSCLVLMGLKGEQSLTECEVYPNNLTVVFSPSGPVKQGPFTIQVKATTPSHSSGSFTLTTYSPGGRIIDQSLPQQVALENISRMHSATALWSNLRAGGETKLSLIFSPNRNFTNGHVRLHLQTQNMFLDKPTVLGCDDVKEKQVFATWNSELGVLDIPMIGISIRNECDSSISITAGGGTITLPRNPGVYPLEVLLNDGIADIESYMLWVNVKGRAFAENSLTSVSVEAGAVSAYHFGFVPEELLPSWEEGGSVELEFEQPAWGDNLGTGLPIGSILSCFSVHAIRCLLIKPAVVQLQQFPSILPLTAFNFTLSGVLNPTQANRFSVALSAYTRSEAAVQFLHSASLSIQFSKGHHTSKPATATLSPRTLGSLCNFSISFQFAERSTALLLQIHSDFDTSGPLLCLLNSKKVPCRGFPGLVLVTEIESIKDYNLLVTGLTSPYHVLPISTVWLYALHGDSEVARFESILPGLSPGTIGETTVTMDNNEAGSLDTTYFFIFTAQHRLDFNGTVRVSFPADYQLITPLNCAFNGTESECSVQNNWVSIATSHTEAYSSVTIRVSHVINPITSGWTSDFALETYSEQGLLIATNSHVPGISLSKKLPKVQLMHLGVRMSPNNRNFPGDLSLSFLPASSLPKGTGIEVTFPALEFPNLPLFPECTLSGAVTLLQNCTANGSTLTAITAHPYLRGLRPTPITLSVRNLRSEGTASESGLFTIRLRFAGFVIEESPASTSNRTLTFSPEPKTLKLVEFDYNPKTAGEEAIYTFTLIPITDFQPSCMLGVRFGSQFPRRLGHSIQCISKELSASQNQRVACYETARTVLITSTLGWQQSASGHELTIEIRRIINPAENLGPIVLFTQCGDTLLDYLVSAPAHTPDVPPQALVLSAFQSSSTAAGQRANITLTVTGLPRDHELDLVLVSFSQDFDLDFVQKGITCMSALFANITSVACDYEQGTVSIAAFPPDFVSRGELEVVVQGVENPWEVLEVLYPVVSVYDVTNEVIVAKTAPNLSRLSGLRYKKSLFSIQVNDNRPWRQNKGTISEFIYVTLEAPASREFSISDRSNIPGVKVSPFAVTFPQGAVSSQFRLEISQSAFRGNYTLEWNVNGAWYEPKYAARRFHVVITDLGNEQVLVNAAESVEQGGQAINTVELQHAPCNELALRLVQLSPQPSRLSFDPEVLRFAPGEMSKQFVIRVASESFGDLGEFFIYKEGINANAYFLPRSVFSFRVKPKENSSTRVTALQVLAVNRTAVRLLAATDKPVSLYWMLASFGTRSPSILEFRSGNFQGKTLENPQFFTTSGTETAPYRYEHGATFFGLRAFTRYSVYVQIVEEGGARSSNFTTLPPLRSAYATLRFRSALESTEREELLRTAAGLLNVTRERLQLIDSKRLNSTLQVLRPGTRSHLSHLVLVTDPYDSGTRSPRSQLSSLAPFRSQLKVASVALDESADITPVDFPYSPPMWKNTPAIGLISSHSIRLDNVLLEGTGRIHLCALKTQDKPPTPLSAQIARGQDFYNENCWYNASVQTSVTHSSVVLNSLLADTSYWVYLGADNDLPGVPDLIEDSQVQVLYMKTLTVEEGRKKGEAVMAGAVELALGSLLLLCS